MLAGDSVRHDRLPIHWTWLMKIEPKMLITIVPKPASKKIQKTTTVAQPTPGSAITVECVVRFFTDFGRAISPATHRGEGPNLFPSCMNPLKCVPVISTGTVYM